MGGEAAIIPTGPDGEMLVRRDITHKAACYLAALSEIFPSIGPELVLDLGASDCTSALTVAAAWSGVRVVAWECSPERVIAGMTALRAAGAVGSRVSLVPAAAMERSGLESFWPVRENAEAGSRFRPSGGYDSIERYSTADTPLSVFGLRVRDWAEREHVRAIDAAWLDLQGGELGALTGFGPELLGTVQVVQAEVCYRSIYADAPLWPDVRAWMEAAGFVLVVRSEMLGGHWGDALWCRPAQLEGGGVRRAVAAALEGLPERP